MEKTHTTLVSFHALFHAYSQIETKNEDSLEILVKMKTKYNLEPEVTHFGCYIDKLVKDECIGEAIDVAAGMKCPISNTICGMIFGQCLKSTDYNSSNRMIEILLSREGTYEVDYLVYMRLCNMGVKFPRCVECGPQHHRERELILNLVRWIELI